jgi:hypothetical protein
MISDLPALLFLLESWPKSIDKEIFAYQCSKGAKNGGPPNDLQAD